MSDLKDVPSYDKAFEMESLMMLEAALVGMNGRSK